MKANPSLDRRKIMQNHIVPGLFYRSLVLPSLFDLSVPLTVWMCSVRKSAAVKASRLWVTNQSRLRRSEFSLSGSTLFLDSTLLFHSCSFRTRSGGSMRVNGVPVKSTDVLLRNGVVHVIEKVLGA